MAPLRNISRLRSALSIATSLVPPLAAAVLLAGCGLFDTREPENPISSGSNFEQPTTPSVVLRNLENAIGYASAADYRRCFSDSSKGLPTYTFIPSAQGLAAAPTKLRNWGIDQEEEYARNVFSELAQGSAPSLVLTPSEVTNVPIGDSVQYIGTYTVRFPHTREGAEREAQGTLEFTMKLSRQNEWYIVRWRDITLENMTSWSLIKARFIDK